MHHYQSRARILAPVAIVWEVLTDVERMPEWTPSVTAVQVLAGDGLALGTRVRIRQPRMPALTWTVDELTPQRHFRWTSTSGGVVTRGDHWLRPRSNGHEVEVVLQIHQTGVLSGLVRALSGRQTARYVRAEVLGLKAACEAAYARRSTESVDRGPR